MASNGKDHFDLLVIGGGSGGLAAAKRAAAHGATVALVEDSRVGGTCVIRGCVPKKLMYIASQLGRYRALSADFGWEVAPADHSWKHLTAMRNGVVDRLEKRHEAHLDRAGVRLIRGFARFEDVHTVSVGGAAFSAERVLVATGARPVIPEIEGMSCCLTSDDFWALEHMPASAVLIGGGYIAAELAGILNGLGCETTLLVRSILLRGFDREIADTLQTAMEKQGIRLQLGAQMLRVERHQGQVAVSFRDGDGDHTRRAESCVLFAVGRSPNTAGLGLEEVGVQLGARGEVLVDPDHRTAVPNIYAVGDVIDRSNLTPVAIKAGRLLADHLFVGSAVRLSYDLIPTAVFSSPPIGAVGMSESEARERLGDRVQVFSARFPPMAYSGTTPERKLTTLMKLIVDRRTDRVLGCHIVGDDAPEIIQGFAVAIQAGATKAVFDRTVAIHPSSAEELVLMGDTRVGRRTAI